MAWYDCPCCDDDPAGVPELAGSTPEAGRWPVGRADDGVNDGLRSVDEPGPPAEPAEPEDAPAPKEDDEDDV